MTALATAIIDDRDTQLTYTPQHGWSEQHIPSDCRGLDDGEQFIARVTDFARNGTWTTATAETGTANITMEFRGTAVYAFFTLFTRVLTESNSDLPQENVARLSFFLNNTLVNPAPLRYDYWWYTDFQQDSIVPNLLMLSQEKLPAHTHTLTIQYSIDAVQGPPQVVLAFDRVQYVPVAGFTTNLPPATNTVSPGPSSSPTSTSTSSGSSPSANLERSSSQTTFNTGMIVGIAVGIFVFLLLVGSLVVGLCWYRRKARRAEANFAPRGTIRPDSVPAMHEPHPTYVTPFVSGAAAHRGRAPVTSSFGNMGASPRTSSSPLYEKSSRPSATIGTHVAAHPQPESPQFSDQSGSSPRAAALAIPRKENTKQRRLVVATSDEEDLMTSSETPTSGLSYLTHSARGHPRPPSYTSEAH